MDMKSLTKEWTPTVNVTITLHAGQCLLLPWSDNGICLSSL